MCVSKKEESDLICCMCLCAREGEREDVTISDLYCVQNSNPFGGMLNVINDS